MTPTLLDPARDYPDWMRKAMQPFDWGLFLAFALGIIAGMHFILASGSVPGSALEHYVFRAQDTAEAIAEGRLYPRWSPEAMGGYGAPLPVFTPPAPGYLAGAITYFFTGNPVSATRGLFALVLGAAASMMFLFSRRLLDAHTGLLAAALYVFNPAVSLDSAIVRGDLPLVMSFALVPAWLWGITRLHQTQKPLNLALSGVIGAALILADPAFALIAGGIGIGYIGWQLGQSRSRQRAESLLVGMALAVALSSFYWLPALLERDSVRWLPPFNATFVDRIDWIAPTRPVSARIANPAPAFSPGWTLLIFAAGGIVTAGFQRKQHPATGFIASIMSILVIASTLPLSSLIFKIILVASALALAVLGGSVLLWRSRLPVRWRRLPLPILLIGVWIGSVPIWLPPNLPETLQTPDDAAHISYELQGFGVAGHLPDQPLPVTIASDLPLNVGLLEGYQSGAVNKLVPSQFTVDVQADLLDHNTHSDRFQLRATNPTHLSVLTACFPGWEAWANDNPIPITCNPDNGLLELNILEPTGGELVIQLGASPPRATAWLISGLTLVIVIAVSLRWSRQWTDPFEDISLLPLPDARLLALTLVATGGLTYWLLQPSPPFDLHPQSDVELQTVSSAGFRSDAGITLTGFRLPDNRLEPGATVNLLLYWGTVRDLSQNFQVQVRLIHTDTDVEWVLDDYRHPGGYPSRRWRPGLTVLDYRQLALPDDLARGNYQVGIQANDCNPDCVNGASVRFFNVDGSELGETLWLPTLLVAE
jgi:hypothetical protein